MEILVRNIIIKTLFGYGTFREGSFVEFVFDFVLSLEFQQIPTINKVRWHYFEAVNFINSASFSSSVGLLIFVSLSFTSLFLC